MYLQPLVEAVQTYQDIASINVLLYVCHFSGLPLSQRSHYYRRALYLLRAPSEATLFPGPSNLCASRGKRGYRCTLRE